jgi:GNAT superfamily N-acetyltransferase
VEKGYEDIYSDTPYLNFDMGGKDAKCWYIDQMYVPPNLRGNGEGKRLIKEFLENELDSDVQRVRLIACSLGSGDTRAFYKSLGFNQCYYGNTDGEDGDIGNIMVLGVNGFPTPRSEKVTSRNNEREMHESQEDLDFIAGKTEINIEY